MTHNKFIDTHHRLSRYFRSVATLPLALNRPGYPYFINILLWIKKLDKDQAIVAYCRGPRCVLAFDDVARLREKGLDAGRLEDAYPEWKSAGLPVEQEQEQVENKKGDL